MDNAQEYEIYHFNQELSLLSCWGNKRGVLFYYDRQQNKSS